MTESDSVYPSDSFIITISNLPENATDEDKSLTIYSDDETLDDWLTFYTYKDGVENTLNSPYLFTSGETVYVKLKKKAPVVGGYKIALWISQVGYDMNEVVYFLDVYITTTN